MIREVLLLLLGSRLMLRMKMRCFYEGSLFRRVSGSAVAPHGALPKRDGWAPIGRTTRSKARMHLILMGLFSLTFRSLGIFFGTFSLEWCKPLMGWLVTASLKMLSSLWGAVEDLPHQPIDVRHSTPALKVALQEIIEQIEGVGGIFRLVILRKS